MRATTEQKHRLKAINQLHALYMTQPFKGVVNLLCLGRTWAKMAILLTLKAKVWLHGWLKATNQLSAFDLAHSNRVGPHQLFPLMYPYFHEKRLVYIHPCIRGEKIWWNYLERESHTISENWIRLSVAVAVSTIWKDLWTLFLCRNSHFWPLYYSRLAQLSWNEILSRWFNIRYPSPTSSPKFSPIRAILGIQFLLYFHFLTFSFKISANPVAITVFLA